MARFEFLRPVTFNGKVYNSIELREMRGSEEDILVSRKPRWTVYDKLFAVLESCTLSIEGVQDRELIHNVLSNICISNFIYLIIMLEGISLGEEYRFKVNCRFCNATLDKVVNFFDFEAKKAEILTDTYELKLGDKVIILKPLTYNDKDGLRLLLEREDAVSNVLYARIVSINGNTQIGLKDIKELTMKERNKIRETIEKLEGGVDDSILVDCNQCLREFSVSLLTDVGFFTKF